MSRGVEARRLRIKLPLPPPINHSRIRPSPRNRRWQRLLGRTQGVQACMGRANGHRERGWLRSSSKTCSAVVRTWSCRSLLTCPWESSRASCAWNIKTRLPQPGSASCVTAGASGTRKLLAPCWAASKARVLRHSCRRRVQMRKALMPQSSCTSRFTREDRLINHLH